MFDHQILGLADQIMATRDIVSFLHLKFSWLKHKFKRQDFFLLKKLGELLEEDMGLLSIKYDRTK